MLFRSFNGISFDIPFLIERGKIHGIHSTFLNTKKQIDLFREMKPLRHVLSLENAKQKTFERFLHIQRNDQYDGGQLIEIFYDYLDDATVETENLLWTHNLEDVIGMYQLLPLIAYKKMLNPEASPTTTFEYLSKSNELFILQEMDFFIPNPLSYRFQHYYLSMEKNKRKLLISLEEKDYRLALSPLSDYMYVESEDIVIPKVLATTMDKSNYCKATKKNCFLRVFANCFGIKEKEKMIMDSILLTPLKSYEKNDPYTYLSLKEILEDPQEQVFSFLFSSILKEIINK